MWTLLSVIAGALLAVAAALGLVSQQSASHADVNSPLVQYGSQ